MVKNKDFIMAFKKLKGVHVSLTPDAYAFSVYNLNRYKASQWYIKIV